MSQRLINLIQHLGIESKHFNHRILKSHESLWFNGLNNRFVLITDAGMGSRLVIGCYMPDLQDFKLFRDDDYINAIQTAITECLGE